MDTSGFGVPVTTVRNAAVVLPPPPPPLSPLPPQSRAVALESPHSRSPSNSRSRVVAVGQWRRCMSASARGPTAALRGVGLRVTPERVKVERGRVGDGLQSGR